MTTHRLAHMRANLSSVGLGEPHVTRWYCVRDVLRQSDGVRLRNRHSARAGCQAGGSGSNHDDRLFRPNDLRKRPQREQGGSKENFPHGRGNNHRPNPFVR